jgi:hypothetical protein
MSFDSLRAQPLPVDTYTNEAYFNSEKRLAALGVSLPPEMRVLEMVSGWPRLVVEALVERLTIEGFYLADDEAASQLMWRWWRANNLDVGSIMQHTEALVQGLGFVIVGPGEGDTPRFTVHSRDELRVHYNGIGRVSEALRRYKAEDGSDWYAHYEPGVTHYFGQAYSSTRFLRAASIKTGLTRVPVVPFINRARINQREGVSEMKDVMALSDACSRSLTNLQVAQELVSMPGRYLLGADAGSFVDATGRPKTQFEVYIGRILLGPAGATAGQFPGAQLDQIINTVKLYAQKVASITGLPNSYLGLTTDNPASAEAINASADRHVKKAEQKQVMFGDGWEESFRIGHELVTGKVDPNLLQLETRWRNAATPTLQSNAQAAVQLVGADIIPAVVARDMVGLTPEQKRIAAEVDRDAANNVVLDVFGGTAA